MSVKIICFVIFLFPSLWVTKPTEIPAIVFVIEISASIRARHPPQTLAIDDEPLDFTISETEQIEDGKTSSGGKTGDSELSASAPSSISRHPTVPISPVSPTEEGGK